MSDLFNNPIFIIWSLLMMYLFSKWKPISYQNIVDSNDVNTAEKREGWDQRSYSIISKGTK